MVRTWRTRRTTALALLAVAAGAGGPTAGAPAASPVARPAPSVAAEDWARFRQVYPYHIQTLALSRPDADGVRTLIVAEPPPDVSEAAIREALQPGLKELAIRRHHLGHGGWTADAVASVSVPDQRLPALLDRLDVLLFGTAYKRYVIDLPALRPRAQRYPLDVGVTAAEIDRWTAADGESFTPVEGGPSITLATMPADDTSTVYVSHRPGLVAWWIPASTRVADCRAQARQFALDSDLIVGGLSADRGLVLLGRERQVPPDVLPPLRFETLLLLASTQSDHLVQSYQRNYPLAGRVDATRDWAPAFLSPELRDTELGSQLNVADQILKSWSNNGETRYEGFDYPPPPAWPFERALPSVLGATRLTYNWNTTGAGYTLALGNRTVYAIQRTGALPVSYLPGEQARPGDAATRSAEAAADRYFAGLRNPDLVRVVQYAAAYQMLRALRRGDGAAPPPPRDDTLRSLADSLIRSVTDATPADRAAVARRMIRQAGSDPADPAISLAPLTSAISQTQQRLGALSPDGRRSLTDALSDSAAEPSALALLTKDDRTVLRGFLAEDGLVDTYSAQAGTQSHAWVHTPVVVLSTNSGGISQAVGGHNIDATPTVCEVRPDAPPGRPRITANGSIALHPRDIPRAGQFVAIAAVARAGIRDPRAARAAAQLALDAAPDTTSPTPRAMAAALAVSVPEGGAPERGMRLRPDDPEAAAISSAAGPEAPEAASGLPAHIGLARLPDGRSQVVSDAPALGAYEHVAFAVDDASDVLARVIRARGGARGPLVVSLTGFGPAERNTLLAALRARHADGEPEEIRALLTTQPESAVDDTLRGPYDATRASVAQDGDPPAVSDRGRRVALRVSAPAVAASGSPLVVRVLLDGKAASPALIGAAIDALRQALAFDGNASTDAVAVARALHGAALRLRGSHPELSAVSDELVMKGGIGVWE